MTVRMNKYSVAKDPRLGRELMKDGWLVAELAAQLAPKSPGGGGGAASIHPELVRTAHGPEVRVSWDRKHFYMGFAETGTVRQGATPFLRAAAARFR